MESRRQGRKMPAWLCLERRQESRKRMDTGLTDRVVMVTGASGGIGGEVVRALVREGARVAAHFGRQAEPAETLARDMGPSCLALGADLTMEAEVDSLFRETESRLGPVEILVAN